MQVAVVVVNPELAAAGSIRFDNDRVGETFRYAMAQSPSFRDLVATIEQTDRTVYVEEGGCRNGSHGGRLFLTTTAGARSLFIRMSPRLPMRSAAAQLAHEPYHAAEVAREPGVTDAASILALYRNGEQTCAVEDARWETRAARAFEAVVTRELVQRTGASEPR